MNRSEDFARFVDRSEMSPAQKTVSMNYVSALRDLERGGDSTAATLSALASVVLAQAPITLEQYERQAVTPDELAEAIREHGEKCALIAPAAGADPLGDALATALPKGKRDLCVGAIRAGGWPAVAAIALFKFGPQIKGLLSSWIS